MYRKCDLYVIYIFLYWEIWMNIGFLCSFDMVLCYIVDPLQQQHWWWGMTIFHLVVADMIEVILLGSDLESIQIRALDRFTWPFPLIALSRKRMFPPTLGKAYGLLTTTYWWFHPVTWICIFKFFEAHLDRCKMWEFLISRKECLDLSHLSIQKLWSRFWLKGTLTLYVIHGCLLSPTRRRANSLISMTTFLTLNYSWSGATLY